MARGILPFLLLALVLALTACERALGPAAPDTPVPTPTTVAQLPDTPLPLAATPTRALPAVTPVAVEVTRVFDDGDVLADSVVVEELELAILESMPVQVHAAIAGHFTLSCTLLDNVAAQREGASFTIVFDAIKDPERACGEAIVPFSTTVPLDVAGLPAGAYTVAAGNLTESFTLAVDNALPTPPPANPTPEPTPVPATITPVPADAGVNVPVNGLFTRTTIHLIALEDAGASGPAIGCGDSVIPVVVDIEPTVAPMTAAYNRLLALKEQYDGESGLYNALYQSNLTLNGINIAGGVAMVSLSGQLVLGGACDAPRVQAQLEQTALQYTTVSAVNILVNGAPLAELLSGQ